MRMRNAERGCEATYAEIAAELGVTRQRVCQIEKAALKKVRAILVAVYGIESARARLPDEISSTDSLPR